MLDFTYVGESTIHKIGFKRLSEHVVSIKGNLKAKTKGFTLSREEKKEVWDYTEYTTIYRELDGEIQFSNDGSIYVKPLPKVTFTFHLPQPPFPLVMTSLFCLLSLFLFYFFPFFGLFPYE